MKLTKTEFTPVSEDKRVGEYQIPEGFVCKYKADLLTGKDTARRTFYQAISPYAPKKELELTHVWKRNCCEYYANQLLEELTEYKIYHDVDYVTTVNMSNVIRLMKKYGYLNDDENDV